MKMNFRYECTAPNGYGVTEWGLKKGDLLKIIEKRLSHVKKNGDIESYYYEYLLSIPEQNICCYITCEQWMSMLLECELIGD